MRQTPQLNTMFTDATVEPASQPHILVTVTNLFTLRKLLVQFCLLGTYPTRYSLY